MSRCLVAVFLVGVAFAPARPAAAQEARQPSATLTLDEVVTRVKAGEPEEAIVASIKRRNRPFDLNSDEIAELKKEGVSRTIISLLVDPALPYTPPPPPPPPPPVAPPPAPLKDPLMLKIPPEPGIYWLRSDEPGKEKFEALEFKPIMPLKPSSGVLAKIEAPLKSNHRIGFLAGSSSGLRLGTSNQIFYVRLGPKAAIDDLVMVRMQKADQRRLLDFGAKPDKPVFAPELILPFDTTILAEGIYRLNLKSIRDGEYVLLVLGSGDDKKGILGKGYEFSAGAPPKK